jgi:hypothetical protein
MAAGAAAPLNSSGGSIDVSDPRPFDKCAAKPVNRAAVGNVIAVTLRGSHIAAPRQAYRGHAGCGCHGSVEIEPSVLLPVGGEDTLAFLSCGTCLPWWEINYVPIDRPQWSVVSREGSDRFKCPGCGKAVAWRIHGPAWRPTYSRVAAAASPGADRPR